MNLLELLKFAPLILAAYLAFHLIFSQKLPTKKLGEVVTYFLGVIIIFFLVSWLVSTFLAGWATNLLGVGTTDEWQQFINQSEELVDDAFTSEGTPQATPVPTAVQILVPVTVAPGTTVPGGSGSESLQRVGPTTYTVVAGDTLNSISRRFGVTVNDLRLANGIPQTSSLITVGQQLTIPAPGS